MNEDVTKLNNRNYVTSIAANAIGSSEIGEDVILDNKSISSLNYLPGVSGWRIDGYGNSEFANVYVRGDINAYSGTIGYWNISQPLVKRTFGDYVIYGTLLESSDLGLTDDGVTSGTYVGLFKSYIDEQISVLSASRDSEIATITVAAHNYSVGDYIKVRVVEDSSFNTNSSIIVDVSDTTYKYYSAGSDVTVDQISGYSILAIKDIAGLYLRDYSRSEFDYGYFSNQGVTYVSAEDINIIENPSFEYKDVDDVLQTATTSWSAGTGLTLATLDIATPYQSDSVYGGKLTWSSSGLSTYLTATIDYAAGDDYGIFDIGRSLYFGISLFPYYVPVAKTITSIESYTTGGYYLKVNSTSHGFSAGDTVFLDVDATYSTTTHSPHTIADGTSGYTFTVLTSPAPSTNYFYITANGTSTPADQVLTLTSHQARSNSVYKVYEAALDLSAIRLRYGNGSTTAISNVLSTATKAQWDAGINKYLLSNANTYMLAYLDNEQTGVDIPAMYKTDLIIIDGESIKAAYEAADPTNFATSADIYLDIPGWLLKHDGNGVVSATKLTDSVSIGYIADNAYLSTASNFFYGTYLPTNRWYGSTDDLISYDPAQASIEGTKTWLDINLTSQSAHLDYFDNIGFRNNTFSKTMLTRPSLGMYDSTETYVPFPDADRDTTTLSSGQYQYKYITDTYRNVSSTLKLTTGDRASGFELSANASNIDATDGEITPQYGAVISGIFDEAADSVSPSTIRIASTKFVWSEFSDQITTLERVVFNIEGFKFNNLPMVITETTNNKTITINAASGIEMPDTLRLYLASTTQYTLDSNTHPLQIGMTNSSNVRMDNNGIQALSGPVASGTLNVNTFGGDVTIGNSASTITVVGDLKVNGAAVYDGGVSYAGTGTYARLRATATSGVGTGTQGFQLGANGDVNLQMDRNSIQVYSGTGSNKSAIGVNSLGGDVTIGSSTSTVSIPGTTSFANVDTAGHVSAGGAIYTSTGNIRTLNGNIYTSSGNIYTSSGGFTGDTIRLTSTTDVTTTSTAHAFQIGEATSGTSNLRIDSNEIGAFTFNTPSTLSLNNLGGTVNIGSTSSDVLIKKLTVAGYVTNAADGTLGTTTSIPKSVVGLGNVENTALSTWGGSTSITTVGSIGTGTWNATAIADGKIASALTGKTYNGLTITTSTGVLTIANSKTLSVNNTIAISATNDSNSGLNIGGGGTLGSAAFTATNAYISSTLMTALGDIIYGGASGAATKLLGNTTSTKKFLRQTGDGTNSAAPAWDTVTKTDVGLGNVTNESKATMFTDPAFTGTATSTGLTVNGQFEVQTGAVRVALFGGDANGSIELGKLGVLTTPFIDFHSGATAVDYDSRIIASGGNGTLGQGTLTYNAATHAFTGNVTGITATMVGLGNVTNESKATMFTDPAFTGTATSTGLTVNGQFEVQTGAVRVALFGGDANGSIELGKLGVLTTPFIDFHSGATTTDYDSRIQASGGTGTTGQGTLTYTAATHVFSGGINNAVFTGDIPTVTGSDVGSVKYDTSLVNRAYLDSQIINLIWREQVKCATTAALGASDSNSLGNLLGGTITATYSNALGTTSTDGTGYFGITSSTYQTIASSGSLVFALTLASSPHALSIGQSVRISVTDTPSTYMDGTITLISQSSMTVTITASSGSGTYTTWTISTIRSTLTITPSVNWTETTIDGQSLAINDRVLIKNQTAALQNGIYVVTGIGAVGTTTPFIFTRAFDSDLASENFVRYGIYVQYGSTYSDKTFTNIVNGDVTMGTTSLTFALAGGLANAIVPTSGTYRIPYTNATRGLTYTNASSQPGQLLKSGYAAPGANAPGWYDANPFEVKTGRIASSDWATGTDGEATVTFDVPFPKGVVPNITFTPISSSTSYIHSITLKEYPNYQGFTAIIRSWTGSSMVTSQAPTTYWTATQGERTSKSAIDITATSGSGSLVTITTALAHGFTTSDKVTIAGVVPTGYNGTYTVSTSSTIRYNRCENPNFTTNATYWTGTGSTGRDTTRFYQTPASLTVGTDGTVFTAYYTESSSSKYYSGGVYTSSAYVYTGSACGVTINIDFYNGNTLLNGSVQKTFVMPAATWTRVNTGAATAPAGTNKIRLWISKGTGGGIMNIDAVLIEPVDTLGTYFDGPTSGGAFSFTYAAGTTGSMTTAGYVTLADDDGRTDYTAVT